MKRQQFSIHLWHPEEIGKVPDLLDAGSLVGDREDLGSDWFQWKFGSSPWGPATVAYARHDPTGRIAGIVAFGRWKLAHEGRTLDAGISYETFVVPEFQRQGLFTRLSDHAQKDMRRRGAEILFNFPNANSRPGFLKLGWTDLGGVETWAKPIRPLRVAMATIRSRMRFQPPTAERVVSFDTDDRGWFDRWSRHCSDRVDWNVSWVGSRDVEFLRWRYRTHPLYRYGLIDNEGYGAVLRISNRMGLREAQLMDIFHEVPFSGRGFRRLMRRIGRETGADMMTMLLTSGHPVRQHLRRAGFLPIGNNVNFFALPLVTGTTEPGSQRDWAISGCEVHTW